MTMTQEKVKPIVTASHLVDRLMGDDGLAREDARATLVKVGAPVVPRLVQLLADQREYVRWEAAQALAEIADPASAEALVRLLEDQAVGVRWVAASGLITMGEAGLPPLLRALVKRSGSVILLRSAHRVIFDLVGRDRLAMLKPLLDALESIEPAVTVPLAAQSALDLLSARR